MRSSDRVLKAVIFDLDGTLYDNRRIKINLAFRNFSHLGMLLSLTDTRGKCRGIDFCTRHNFHTHLFNEIQKRTGRALSDIENWYFDVFYSSFTNLLKEKYRKRPGVESTLIALKDCGIYTAVLSDYLYVRERVKALAFDVDLFDILASSEDYGVLKPSKRPLLDIASRLGVKTSHVGVVGDRDDTDGKAASMANMCYQNIKRGKDQYWSWFGFGTKPVISG